MKTKKISSFILASACVAILGSCDMDKYPYDRIPVENALTSLSDCQYLRSGMYRDLRIISANENGFLATEMQADCIVPTNNYGYQYSSQYLWEIEAADQSATTTWSNNYVAIAQCNMLIGGIPGLEASGSLAEGEIAEAYNIPSRTVTEREDLDDAIREMLETDGPFLLQAAVMEQDNVLPMCSPGHDVDDMLLEL